MRPNTTSYSLGSLMHLTKNKASKCVMARIMRQGKSYQKNFTLREYSTWTAAEKAGARWVKKMIRELPEETPRVGRMSKRNSSGIVGVWPTIDRHTRGGKKYEYCRWGARWPECPRKGGIRWSVSEYGDNDAFVLAALSREYESVDRDWLLKKLKRIRKTKRYKTILKNKLVDFVDD